LFDIRVTPLKGTEIKKNDKSVRAHNVSPNIKIRIEKLRNDFVIPCLLFVDFYSIFMV